MDEETRNIELMKIAATLTLARCVLFAASEPIPQETADRNVTEWFIEDVDRLRNDLEERLATSQGAHPTPAQ